MYEAWTVGAAPDEKARIAFLWASTWADTIKGMSDYRNDGPSKGNRPRSGSAATQNIGYADHLRHKYWHFIDLPFSSDGTELEAPASPNLQTQIATFRTALSAPDTTDDVKSYDFVWLIHLVGDVHQPLHTTSRFTKALPQGDEGGNAIKIFCRPACAGSNLHAFWDDLLGPHSADLASAAGATRHLPEPDPDRASIDDEKVWLKESFELAKSTAYASPIGDNAGPFQLSEEYRRRATEVAKEQIALSGARLARLLNAATSDR
jgi:hypothetical protein